MNPTSIGPDEIDLTARPRSTQVAWSILHTITLLVAAGCLASFVAGPENIVVRMLAGAFGVVVALLYVMVWAGRHRVPARMVVNHEGIRLRNGRGKVILRLAWTELSGVGVMTNEVSRYWQQRDAGNDLVTRWVSRRTVRIPIWLELYPANAEAVERHPELELAWKLGQLRAAGEEQRWLVGLGDGRGQNFPIGEVVQRWRPQLWRGHRSDSIFFAGGHRGAGRCGAAARSAPGRRGRPARTRRRRPAGPSSAPRWPRPASGSAAAATTARRRRAAPRPARVALACCVAAFLLPTGTIPPDLAREDTQSVLREHLVVDPGRGTRTVRDPEAVFYGRCTPEDAARAAARLTPEPLPPAGGAPTALTPDGFGRVPKVYVVCEEDRALGPAAQERMTRWTPCRHVYRLPADHSPFLSAPDALTGCLHDAATRFGTG